MPDNGDEAVQDVNPEEFWRYIENITQARPRESLSRVTPEIASGEEPRRHAATPGPATPVLPADRTDYFGDFRFGHAAMAARSDDQVSPLEGPARRGTPSLPLRTGSFLEIPRKASPEAMEQHEEAGRPHAPTPLPPGRHSIPSRVNSAASLSQGFRGRSPSRAPTVGQEMIAHVRARVEGFAKRNEASGAGGRILWPEVEAYGIEGDPEDMARDFAPAAYLNAIAVASRSARLTLLIREAGPETVERLQTSRRTKGTDIKAKTIKQTSLEEFYGAQASRLVQVLREQGLTGYAGVWSGKGALQGVLLSEEAWTKPEYAEFVRSRDAVEDGPHDGRPYLPLDLPDPLDAQGLEAFRKRLGANPPPRALLENEAYTGDLDFELVVRNRAIATQGSSDENFAKDLVNAAILAVDPRRDGADALPVRHGSEKNHTAHRRNEQGDMAPATPNTRPDARLLMVKRGVLSIVRQDEALDGLRQQGINDSRRSSEASPLRSRHPSRAPG